MLILVHKITSGVRLSREHCDSAFGRYHIQIRAQRLAVAVSAATSKYWCSRQRSFHMPSSSLFILPFHAEPATDSN